MKLVETSWTILPDILKVLENNFPDTTPWYNILKGYNDPTFYSRTRSTLFTPNGLADNYGTFLIKLPESRETIFFHTLCPNSEDIEQALIDCIDWNRRPTIGPVYYKLLPTIDSLCRKLNFQKVAMVGHAYFIPQANALSLDLKIPDECYLADITLDHAKRINDVWPHGEGAKSLKEVENYINCRPGVGLFLKDNNELIAWGLQCEFGPGLVQVDDKYHRKGYGSIISTAITRKFAESGYDPVIFIVDKNIASQNLFTKLGYKKRFPSQWITIWPQGCEGREKP